MKKRVAFVMNGFACGGVARSLVSVLSLLPEDRFEISLIFIERQVHFRKTGILCELPGHVQCFDFPFLPADRYELEHGRKPALFHAIKHLQLGVASRMILMRIRWYLSGRRTSYSRLSFEAMVKRAPRKIDDHYDYAFAYGGLFRPGVIVQEWLTARVKANWSHLECIEHADIYENVYRKFGRLFACSQKLANQLNAAYCPNENRFSFFPYYLNPDMYRLLASRGAGFSDGYNGVRVLSIGRLCEQKGFDLAIDACRMLKSDGYDFKWYVVGEGSDRAELTCRIKEQGVTENFLLCGQQTNPYPYIEQCDIYVQPSRYEGYCLTVAEARVFCKPIVCTDFAGADEQIKNGVTGVIAKEVSAESIYEGVKSLFDHPEKCRAFSRALSGEIVDNEKRVRNAWSNLLEE